jgi:hypothetical protein
MLRELILASILGGGLLMEGAPVQAQEVAEEIKIGEREIVAVQRALISRGYLLAEPSGRMDQATREGLLAFQESQGLRATGEIDRAVMDQLGVSFPVADRDDGHRRRQGWLPKIGYRVKDTSAKVGKATAETAREAGRGTKRGVTRAVSATGTALDRSGEKLQDAGEASIDGVKGIGKGLRVASTEVEDRMIGRSDAEIQRDVRALLNARSETRSLRTEVERGEVTLVSGPGQEMDLSPTVSEIRKISGVRSVVVVPQ